MSSRKIDWIVTMVWVLAGAAVLLSANEYHALVIGSIACMAIVGIGLNILMGLAGQTSLGHAAFYAIGAYTATIASMTFGLPYVVAVALSAILTGAAGALLSLPALRVKGPYLAMVTIAFGYFVEQGIADWKSVTGGWNGIMNIPRPRAFGYELNTAQLACVVIVIAGFLVPAFSAFARSRWGIVMRATRDAEVASSSLGANLMAVRAIAFGLSAALTGIAGAFFASLNGFISPESFPFFQSLTFLLMVMIGGIGHAAGPLAGALLVVLLPETLAGLAEYRLMFFGGLLLAVLLIVPNGIAGTFATLAQRQKKPKTGDVRLASAAVAKQWFTRTQPLNLTVSHLGISFGGNRALDDVSITAAAGRVTSLIGPNGAGKTTLLNLVTGFYQPTQGLFKLGDQELTGLRDYQIGRNAVSRTFQTSQLFNEMTVLENIYFGMLRGRLINTKLPEDAWAICEGLLDFVGFKGDTQGLAGALPHVDRRLVEIARALASQPALLLLDEPAAGLSAEDKTQLTDTLLAIAAAGVGVFIIEHDMKLVMRISDHIHVLDGGRLLASGNPDEIKNNPQVKLAYLGESRTSFATRIEPLDATQPTRPQDILVIRNLYANYGASDVLSNVALDVRQGQTVSVLGANGAGKSTLMRVMSGLHKKFKGSIAFNGLDISNLPAHKVASLGLVMVPEGRQVFTELSVQDNIVLGAHTRGGLSSQQLRTLYDMFPKLEAIQTRRAGLLSGGEQQMLAIARGLASSPLMMMLDEPSLGLAPAIVDDLFMRLAALRNQGLTLLLVDQMADLALTLSHQSNLLDMGQITFSGSPDALLESGLLDLAYLG